MPTLESATRSNHFWQRNSTCTLCVTFVSRAFATRCHHFPFIVRCERITLRRHSSSLIAREKNEKSKKHDRRSVVFVKLNLAALFSIPSRALTARKRFSTLGSTRISHDVKHPRYHSRYRSRSLRTMLEKISVFHLLNDKRFEPLESVSFFGFLPDYAYLSRAS